MGMTVHEYNESRKIGTPVPFDTTDGYGSLHLTTAATAEEVDLRRNSVYRLVATTEDCYVMLLDLGLGESSVTATTGMKILKDDVEYITTTKDRHVLSYIAGGAGTLQCVRMDSRSGR